MKYKYDIIRAPRKSISIIISNENKITLRCPWELPQSKIDEFLDSKEDWIDKVVLRNARRLAANDDVIEHRSVYFNGNKLPLIIAEKNLITNEAVYVKRIEDIESLYVNHCSEEFYKTVNTLAEEMKLYPSSVKIKKYKGRWGCCDGRNNLIFNFMLFMLPPEVRKYVIVHELCHILCHNHSAAFWKLVSEFEPNYNELKKRLATFDFLTNLY